MIINGNKIARKKLRDLKKYLAKTKSSPQLDIIYIPKDSVSEVYIRNKKRIGEEYGFKVKIHKFESSVNTENIVATCNTLNLDPNCNGIIIQLPISSRLIKDNVLDCISPLKDVDCLTSTNLGKAMKGVPNTIMPATVSAISSILTNLRTHIKSKKVTIVNDSNLIGKPLSGYFLSREATVTICNEFTKNLEKHTEQADILITAVGERNLISGSMIKPEAIVIDAGITKYKNKIVGDVDFASVSKNAKAITPVPGGVGPITIASLFENLVKLYKLQSKK